MSKIMKMIRYFSVAALASLLAHSVWAAITPTSYTEASGYQKFSYSKIINWRGDGATFHNQKVTELLADGTEGDQYSQTANNNDKSWQRFAENQNGFANYASPVGLVLRLDSTTATKQIDAQFAPFNMGGLIVEAEGYSFVSNNNDARGTLFGDTSGNTETYMDINKSVTFTRGGSDNSNTKPNTFYGTVNLFIAEGAVFNFNADNTKTAHKVFMKGSKDSATGGCLKMSGAGQLKLKTLNAEGNTLDYSALSLDRTTAFIVGNLVVNAETKYAFPAGLAANTPFKLCSGTITKNGVDVATTIRVGNEEKKVNLTFDTANGTVSYALEAASWTPNTANTAAIMNGILDWTATDAWLDAEGNAATWPTGDHTDDGLAISVVIDAKDIAGVKISGQVKAEKVAVECSDNMSHEFQFHNHTLGVEGTTTTDDTVDCLTTAIVNLADFGGDLGLKVPIAGSVNFSASTHLVFKTGDAQGDASTAYGYTIVGNAAAIEVAGEGKFKVPASMYGISFAPQATATIVYDEAGTVTGAITGAGKVEISTSTVTVNTTLDCAGGIVVESGTAIFPESIAGESIRHDVTVKSGAVMEVQRQDGFSYSHDYTIDIYGTLKTTKRQSIRNAKVKLHNGAVIDGTSTDSQGDFEYIASKSIAIDEGAVVTIKRLGLRGANTLTVNGNNSTLKLQGGVYGSGKIILTDGVTIITDSTTTAKIEKSSNVTGKVLDVATNEDGSKTYSLLTYAEAGLIKDNIFAGKTADYWKSIFVGPAADGEANASELAQWIAPTGTSLPPLASNSDRWQPALFDGTLMVNVEEEDGYKNIPATKWEGWQLQVGLVNGAKVTVAELVKIQDTQGVGCFIGVDSTSKLVVSKFNNGSHNGMIDFDIAAPEGLVVNNGMSGNDPVYSYAFRGNGSIKVDGAFNSGRSHKVKYVEISADEIGTGTFKAIKERKLVGFTSSTLAQENISFASGAMVKVGESEASTAYAKPAGYVLSAKDVEGAAQIVKKADGIYVQFIGRSAERPSQYQWEFQTVGNWSAANVWKGLYNDRLLTWSENHIKTADTKDTDFIDEGDVHYINLNPVNDFEFFFDASKTASVVVDTAIAAEKAGVSPTTGEIGTAHRSIKVVGSGTFKFNLPQGDNVDTEGAPLAGFDWDSAAEISAPIDATGFNGELGLRAKMTGPITLGPNAKVVFVKPGTDETIAYPYSISGNGTIEVRGSGKFVVPSNMTGVAFEITAGDDASAGAIIYDVPSDETMTVTAAITGAGAVIKRGAGTLVLPSTCAFTGGLKIENGEVKMNAPTDATRLRSIVVSEGATYTLVVSAEQIETGYNASNVSGEGTLKIVDANGVDQTTKLLPGNILRGTKNIWKHGVINNDYITTTAMAVLYDLHVSEVTGSDAIYTLSAKLGGGSVNGGTPLDATIVVADAVDAEGWLHIQIQVVHDNYLKVHEIAIKDGTDETGNYDAILAKSILTGYVTGGSVGTFVTEFTRTGEDYKTVYLRADATGVAAKIGENEYPTIAKAIAVAKTGDVIKLQAAYSSAINIPEGVTVDVNGQTFTGTVTGAGKLVMSAFPNTAAALKTSLQQSTWTGTLVIRGASLAGTTVGSGYCCTFNEYGHIGSKIELDNCSGYFGVYTDAVPRVIPEVVITGTFTRTTVGYSKFRTVFRKISGSGTFAGSTGGSNQTIYFEDVSDFTGTITTSNDNIVIGPAGDGLDERGHLHIAEGTVFAVPSTGTWSATMINVDGTLDFRGTSRETAFFAGDTTIGEAASIRFPADWAENATLPICTGTLTASDTETAVPIMVGDYAFKAKLRYDIPSKSVSYRCDSSVTPVALWKGDFNTATKGGITLNANDNTIADDDAGSVVTIASTGTKGVTFNVTDNTLAEMGQKGTVLVKYSSLSTPASNAMLFSFRTNGYDNDILGMYLNNSGTLATAFNNGTHNGGSGNGQPTESGMFAETIAFTAGAPDREGPSTFIKDLTSAEFEVGREARGVYVSSQTITGFAIGGPRSSGNFTKLAGMKIEAVAVFNKVLTTDEMNSYDWGFDGEDPTMTWNGADGADIGTLSNWTTDSSNPSFEDFDLLFPSTVDEEVKSLTVSAGFTTPVAAKIEGAYKLTSGTLNMSSLSFGANGSLRIEKGAKVNLEGFTKALLSKITFAGGSLTVAEAQRFTSADVLNIADVSELPAGAYEMLMWEGHPNSGTTGYGRPATPVITGVKTGWEAKLVYQTHGIVLLLRDPEWLARPALTIWPFGDSITEGMNQSQTHANYRIQLYQKLQLLGYNVKSVGFSTRTYNQRGAYDPSGVDISAEEDWVRHSGVGGELACHYTSNHGTLHDSWANALDQAGDPDIVLIHIGINDITSGASNGSDGGERWRETYGSVTNMAANILRERPNTKVVLSSMNRLEKGQTYQGNGNANYVKPFRDEMVALMTKVKSGEIDELPADRVLFADMYDAIRPRSFDNFQEGENEENGLFESDHIHPNWEGHHRMSDCWLTQVRAAFPDPKDTAGVFHSRRGTPAEVSAEKLGAEKNVPKEYLNGFTKATVIKPAENGMERASTVTINKIVADTTAISKVGYYVEYVFPSATTNIHRWVWVDMDAIKDGMTVGEAGLPTKTIQQVVNKLHVASNHLAIHPVAATDDSVKGFIEFSPYSFGGNGNVAGGPTHWMNDTSWNDAFGTGSYGSMQLHRMAPGANPYDPGSKPPAEVLFAYNAWNCGNDGKATEFGIGDFNQHLTGFTTDWVNMRNTETMHSGCLKAKSIEIWVKPVAIESVDVEPTEEGIEVTKPAGAESVVVETSEGATVSGNTIPLTATGLYTIKAKVGDTVVATETLGVIAAKDAEDSADAKVTTAVAVPFEGATVANLLNTALLKDGDTLMAYIDGSYRTWALTSGVWVGQPINVVGGDDIPGLPATTALARGSAVWVMTAGKIVVLGKYNESAAIVVPTAKETHLLANPTMGEYTPTEAAENDEVIIIGEEVAKDVTTVRYAKTSTGWKRHTFKKVANPFGGSAVGSKEVIDETAPSVPVGKGFWFMKK